MEPWTVTSPTDGVLRFTNATHSRAAMIAVEPVGDVQLGPIDPGDPYTSFVSEGRAPGEYFERRVTRRTGSGPAGIRVRWMIAGIGPRTWVHSLTDLRARTVG